MDEKHSIGEEREASPNKIDYLSSEGESSVWLTLSPIVELNETSIVDSTISDIQGEEISFTEPGQDDNHDCYKKFIIKNDEYSNNLSIRPSSLQPPEVPPTDIRNRLSKLECQYEYLENEHKDLIEFTRLEKQVLHEDCVSKEKMKSLEDEFAQVNSKVYALMQENQDFVTKMDCKDEEIKELKTKLNSCAHHKREIGRKILEIGQKLKEDMQMDVKDILKNNPSFELLLRKEDLHIGMMLSRSDFDETENILQTLKEISDLLIFQKNEFKLKNDSLYLNNELLNKTNDQLSRKLQDTENILGCTINEKEQLLAKINIANSKDKEIMNSLHTTQSELKKTLMLLDIVNKDNTVMQDQICNINNQKDKLMIIFHELLKQVNSLNRSFGIKDVISELEKNDSFLETMNVVCSSNIQSIIYDMLNKVKTWFNLFEEDRNNLFSNVKDFSNICLQNLMELKLKVNILENMVEESVFKKINSLNNTLTSYYKNKVCVEEKCINMQEENKNLSEAIVILDNKLKDALILLETSVDEKIQLENYTELINSKESSLQNDIYSILKEVEISIDMWDGMKGVKDLFDKIRLKKDVYNRLFFFDLKNQSFFFRLVEKLEKKIEMCDKDLHKLELVMVESTNQIIQLENDGNAKEKSHQEIGKLKYLLNTYENENSCLKNDIEDLKSKYSTKANEIQSYFKEQKCFAHCSEQLNTLREIMIVEITSLNFEESKEDLQKYSSVDIFSKLMQNIIRKEAEITLDIQTQLRGDIEVAQNELEKFHHKHKSQESWISSLENENEKMSKEVVNLKKYKEELENKIKYLSTSLKYSSSEVSLLKNKLSELATENDTMRNTVHNFKEAVESEKEIAQSLKIQISDLREELISKTKEIANLKLLCNVKKPDVSKDIPSEKESIKTCKISCSEPPRENIAIFDSKYFTVDSNYHLVENSKLKTRSELETKTEEISNLRINEIIATIEKEKEILTQALAARSLNNVKNLNISHFVLKDVFVCVINKVTEMESAYAEEISNLQNCVFMARKELAELKTNLEQLYKDLSLDIPMSGVDGFMEPWKDTISLKIELDFAKEECELINKRSLEIENSAKTGRCLVHTLRQEFQDIKSEISIKEKIIDKLKKTISLDQKKYRDKKTEFERQINQLKLQNDHTKEQVNQMQSQLSVMTSHFTDFNINFPVEINDMKSKMDYINDIFKQKAQQECVIDSLISENGFFSVQCSLMSSYIKSKDHCLEVTKKENEHLTRMIDLLDNQVAGLKTSLNEKNIFLSNVITELPKKTRTLNEAVELVQEMCIEYGHLNKSELSFLQECKKNADQITVLQNELKVANNVIESLKSELNNCEDHIRNLRSEVRSVRLKQRRQEIEHTLRDEKSEIGIQTETLCCTNLNEQLEQGKNILEARCCQITSLKLQLQGNIGTYQKKVSDLEQALVKAKERIFKLQSENSEYKTYNANLIESYNGYKEELSKAYKDIELLKTQIRTQ